MNVSRLIVLALFAAAPAAAQPIIIPLQSQPKTVEPPAASAPPVAPPVAAPTQSEPATTGGDAAPQPSNQDEAPQSPPKEK